MPNNPVVIANVIVEEHKCYLFIDSCKVPSLVKLELEAEGIELKANHEIQKLLQNLSSGDAIIFDTDKTRAGRICWT